MVAHHTPIRLGKSADSGRIRCQVFSAAANIVLTFKHKIEQRDIIIWRCSVTFFKVYYLDSKFAVLCKDTEVGAGYIRVVEGIGAVGAVFGEVLRQGWLAVMKAGGWLSPQKSLEWGFVDEIMCQRTKRSDGDGRGVESNEMHIDIAVVLEDCGDRQAGRWLRASETVDKGVYLLFVILGELTVNGATVEVVPQYILYKEEKTQFRENT